MLALMLAAPDADDRARAFDVVCAGEALWRVSAADGSAASLPRALRFRPGGGAVGAAIALAREHLHVGLATVIADDSAGRALVAQAAAAGIDVGGVELARPSVDLLRVEGGARQIVSLGDAEQPVAIPEGWSSQVLLLSGMSPVVAQGAALCKAARVARRAGALVVVDVNTRWHLWQGRDPRAIRMVLREADVVWCSAEDLFGLNMDVGTMRAALRPGAVLAVSDGAGNARATGPFGEVTQRPRGALALPPTGEDDAFTVAICAELARAAGAARGEAMWARALARGHAMAAARIARP
jgi:sugar/nucleoside kinase (ribokinase family)